MVQWALAHDLRPRSSRDGKGRQMQSRAMGGMAKCTVSTFRARVRSFRHGRRTRIRWTVNGFRGPAVFVSPSAWSWKFINWSLEAHDC